MGHSLSSVRSRVCELLCLALPVLVMGTMAEGKMGNTYQVLRTVLLVIILLTSRDKIFLSPSLWVSHGCNPVTPGEFPTSFPPACVCNSP